VSIAIALAVILDAALIAALIATRSSMRRRIERQTQAADVIVALNAVLQTEIDELRHRSQDMEMLTEMSELLQLSADIGEACQVLPAFGARLFPGSTGSVHVTGAVPDMVETKAWWGDFPPASDFAVADCWALRRARAHVGTIAGIRCPHTEGQKGVTLCAPMIAVGDAIGVVTLNLSDSLSIPPHVEQFAHSFADQISFALANLRLQETLRTHALRDVLTGLFNRRYLEKTLAAELARASRAGRQIGVMLIDVDHFKRFNDTHGHAGGDALLEQLARVMQSAVGEADLVCRYGGEEFVVLLPDVEADVLRSRAESLVEAARRLQVHVEGTDLGPITVSAGIALSNDSTTNAAALLAVADRSLYIAKASGRDRVAGPVPHIVAA